MKTGLKVLSILALVLSALNAEAKKIVNIEMSQVVVTPLFMSTNGGDKLVLSACGKINGQEYCGVTSMIEVTRTNIQPLKLETSGSGFYCQEQDVKCYINVIPVFGGYSGQFLHRKSNEDHYTEEPHMPAFIGRNDDYSLRFGSGNSENAELILKRVLFSNNGQRPTVHIEAEYLDTKALKIAQENKRYRAAYWAKYGDTDPQIKVVPMGTQYDQLSAVILDNYTTKKFVSKEDPEYSDLIKLAPQGFTSGTLIFDLDGKLYKALPPKHALSEMVLDYNILKAKFGDFK